MQARCRRKGRRHNKQSVGHTRKALIWRVCPPQKDTGKVINDLHLKLQLEVRTLPMSSPLRNWRESVTSGSRTYHSRRSGDGTWNEALRGRLLLNGHLNRTLNFNFNLHLDLDLHLNLHHHLNLHVICILL